MNEPETFTHQVTVRLVDADNVPIREGSVLQHIQEGERGVVQRIIRPGATDVPMAAAIGDLVLRILPNMVRVTNQYSKWRHVPHDAQTYRERFESWCAQRKPAAPGDPDRAPDAMAISAIMHMLPSSRDASFDDIWPDSLEGSLRYLTNHLTDLHAQIEPK